MVGPVGMLGLSGHGLDSGPDVAMAFASGGLDSPQVIHIPIHTLWTGRVTP
jgi:hypothetical protein